ncbi:MAG: SiaB family protein kinase [Candidatus Magnetobacterium sp. LHC-1]|uniref:Uncharacterized protein n=1 Tax=Candidatus Magnetobacterium casense TaxID=1455061 RepID=A0ABS6RTT6_9BACT|nr:SiaB family protein kinase [Candidatus Magnetobacterium casensis]MBF0607129.1 hypothetical protein [Nitrospirota bacterium]MBV6340035.1 hypothetical protein [Candidatus Magnetobacterium casensis]
MIDKIRFIKQQFDEEGIIVSLSGILSHSIIAGVAEAVGESLEKLEINNKLVNNVFSIFIEMAQNLITYVTDRGDYISSVYKDSGIILVGYDKKENRYFVASGNTILASDKARIHDKVGKIIAMDSGALKEYYRTLRKSGQDAHSKGAGLGFIEMQRKASAPLQYRIDDISETEAFFSIKAELWEVK